jgi:hypothetical protein
MTLREEYRVAGLLAALARIVCRLTEHDWMRIERRLDYSGCVWRPRMDHCLRCGTRVLYGEDSAP